MVTYAIARYGRRKFAIVKTRRNGPNLLVKSQIGFWYNTAAQASRDFHLAHGEVLVEGVYQVGDSKTLTFLSR